MPCELKLYMALLLTSNRGYSNFSKYRLAIAATLSNSSPSAIDLNLSTISRLLDTFITPHNTFAIYLAIIT